MELGTVKRSVRITILVIIIVVISIALFTTAFSPEQNDFPTSTVFTTENLQVASTPAPLQLANWENKSIHRVSLTVNQSFQQSESSWYSDFVGKTAIQFLAKIGIEAVETPPYDAELTIDLNGEALGEYYAPPGYTWEEALTQNKLVTALTAAAVNLDFHISTENREATVTGFHETGGGPYKLEKKPSLRDVPMDYAKLRALIEALAKLWGTQVYVSGIENENEDICYATVNEMYDNYQYEDLMLDTKIVTAITKLVLLNISPDKNDHYISTLILMQDQANEIYPDIYPEILPYLLEGLRYGGITFGDRRRSLAENIFVAIGFKSISALIDEMSSDSDLVRESAFKCAALITGQDFGQNLNEWQEWWNQNKQSNNEY